MSNAKKWIKRRRSKACYDWAKTHGYSSLIAHLLSGRYSNVSEMESALQSTLKDMDKPNTLPDIDKAARRIAKAVMSNEVIAIETDHDCDGVTSHSIIYEVLHDIIGHPVNKIRSFIGHRLKEGYGLSDSVADRIIADSPRPSLVITADNGSSDEPRIAKLKVHNIDVIVTDHHEIPVEGIPQSALAVVSPAREDSEYPDPLIAGCMVACLTMAAVRQELINQGYFKKTPSSVVSVFDYVALGTVADCVSMSRSKNNRLVVEYGLKLINEGNRACWRALKPYLGEGKQVTSEDLGFSIGPRINARGRLDEAMLGVRFLLTKSDTEAVELADVLDIENNERKRIENELKTSAMVIAEDYIDQGYQSLVIFLENGHSGVHGIVASRITEAYGRPSIVISPKLGEPEYVSASARGVDGFHVRQTLQGVADKYPGLLPKFGGHKGAAGLTIKRVDIERFRVAFEEETKLQIAKHSINIGPVILTDGPMLYDYIKLETIDEYSMLEPFGREMDAPLFESKLRIVDSKRIGAKQNHLKLTLQAGNKYVNGIWFNVDPDMNDDQLGITNGTEKCFLFSLSKNQFRGNTTLQLRIQDAK